MIASTLSWSPYGAAASGEGTPPFPADVVEAAAKQDLGPELVHLAWEIARLAPLASAAEGRALLLLALAVLAAQRDGSTRVPLDPAGPLAGLLESLGGTAADRTAVAELLAAADVDDPRLRPLFGVAGGSDQGAGAQSAPYRPLLRAGGYLYSQRLWQLERRVASRLRELLAAPLALDRDEVEAALEDIRRRPARDAAGRPVPLTEEQEAAVRAALAGRLTAVTGGPGTGKTWIVAAMLRVVARLADPPLTEIALAAPTGKAADRLQGSIRAALAGVGDPAEADCRLVAAAPSAATLHRLLSYSPSGERFLRHERSPLGERLVLVDESSMLDLSLADRLLRSLPAGGRLVLLGDAQQLPSVEAGAVFRDLVQAAAGSGRVARLTRSWRIDESDPAGSAIFTLAARIASGQSPVERGSRGAALAVRDNAADLGFAGAELLLSPPVPLAVFLERWWQERVFGMAGWVELVAREWRAEEGTIAGTEAAELERLFIHHQSARLLSPTRGWTAGTGVAALNGWFRAALVRAVPLVARGRGRGAAEEPLPGEPILITRNDYRRTLYNGDQGLVLRVAAEGEPAIPMAVLRSSTPGLAGPVFRVFPLGALRAHLEPAWASTVHKAQGSEHDAVALILPPAESRLLTRELLYTAVTRARSSVVLVGTEERLAAAAVRAVERWSGIAEALAPAAPTPAVAPTDRGKPLQLRLFPE